MALQSTTALANVTLQASSSTITFSGIPAVYRDLVVVGSLRTDRASTSDPIRIRFNNDSTNGNYHRISMSGNGSTASAYTDAPTEIIVDAGATAANATANVFSVFRLELFDYSQTNKHKTGLTYSDVSAVETRRQAARWASTSAVTSISIAPYFGTVFASGSTLSLYGVIA
jgi:hypothetical protein